MCRTDGSVVASAGEINRPFFLRSSAKPFQAMAAQDCGAGLAPIELALCSASHRGHPVQVAIVEGMLATIGLDEGALQCPPDFPLNASARNRLLATGHVEPRRIWHNCSGKHAGFLRACVAAGWSTDDYLRPDHPLQRRAVDLITELGRLDATPVGVDGCGAPVARTTARAMATLFATLAVEPALRPVFTAMHRYPALVSGNGEGDAAIATALDAVSKGGAQGCIGVGLGSGIGVAVKSWDGSHDAALVGVVAALVALGSIGRTAAHRLGSIARPIVTGGVNPVGALEPRLELRFE